MNKQRINEWTLGVPGKFHTGAQLHIIYEEIIIPDVIRLTKITADSFWGS